MSDIGLDFGPFGYVGVALFVGAPGLVIGALLGAILLASSSTVGRACGSRYGLSLVGCRNAGLAVEPVELTTPKLRCGFDAMKLGFEETQASYSSGSQRARAWTERWVHDQVYCPNCGSLKISAFPNNAPVADFFCASCKEEYELKSQKNIFGKKVLDGSFKTKCERLAADNNPNLFLLNYDLKDRSVRNFLVVPKHFFVREIIEERKPLAETARRAGWVGSNILLN